MNATRKSNRWGAAATDAELEQAVADIHTLQERGWSITAISEALRYKDYNYVRHILSGYKRITQERAVQLRQLVENTNTPAAPAPRTSRRHTPTRTVLDCLDNIDQALAMAHEEALSCREQAIPLLRAGLTELANDIAQLRKRLEV